MTTTLPWLAGSYVSDGGLETDLIFNKGLDLPEFASFPLLDGESGREVLRGYYDEYAAVARKAGTGLTLESPTWRANTEWGSRVGYDQAALDRVNRAAISFLGEVRDSYGDLDDVRLIGTIGPRGDGYVAGDDPDADEFTRYHAPQVEAFAAAGADVVAAYTLTTQEEAVGVARAARQAGIPALIGFTVETDGRLPDGSSLADAVTAVDAAESPEAFVVNCAHPLHIAPALASGDWLGRIVQVNPNASTLSHTELDESEELDAGDLGVLTDSFATLRRQLPSLAIVGGCCGTDSRHVAALAGV